MSHFTHLLLKLNHLNSKYKLPVEANGENIYIDYILLKTKSFIKENLLVVVLDIPLSNIMLYDLYELHPLLTPHDDTKLSSYIEQSTPYLLLSITRTVYSTMNSLKECIEYVPTQWLCKEVTTTKRIKHSNCEIELFFKFTSHILKTCSIRHLYADTEIWDTLGPNQWLFITSRPTSAINPHHKKKPSTKLAYCN